MCIRDSNTSTREHPNSAFRDTRSPHAHHEAPPRHLTRTVRHHRPCPIHLHGALAPPSPDHIHLRTDPTSNTQEPAITPLHPHHGQHHLGDTIPTPQPHAPATTNTNPRSQEPPDSAPHPHSGITSKQTDSQDPSRPPNSAPPAQSTETRAPHTPRRPRALGGDDLDTPILPNRITPHHRITPCRSWATTQQPGFVAPPLENSPPTHTAACRNGPPASPPRTLSRDLPRRTARHQRTGPQPQATCHGQGSRRVTSPRDHLRPLAPPHHQQPQPKVTTWQPGHSVPHRHPTHDTGNR